MVSKRNRFFPRRLLGFESLEIRRVLAGAVFLSEPLHEMVAIEPAHDLTRELSDPLETMGDAVEYRSRAMPGFYFSSIQQVDVGRFQVAKPNLPAKEDDFLIQRARPFELAGGVEAVSEFQMGDILQLNLFEDAIYRSIVQSNTTNINGTSTIVVKLQDYDFAFGYISMTNGDFLVSIDVPEERAYFETRMSPNSDAMLLVQFDSNRPDVLEERDDPLEPIRVDKPDKEIESQGPAVMGGATGGLGGDQTQVDVMVVYTPAAESWSGNINNTVATAMARSNTAANNSNLGLTFNLVYSGLVNYTESGSGSGTDLSRLRNPSDGFMDEVHTIRDTHAADLVSLLSFTNSTGGIGYLNTSRYGIPDSGFSLTRVQQASSTDTFVHEMGHNMGAMHSKSQSVQAGPTPWFDWPENNWTAGWRFQGNDGNYYTSVMAYSGGQYYPDGNNATRIPYFSDPSIVVQGQPIGNSVDGDNARSLREVRRYISNYRDADTLMYCSAGGGEGGLGITNVQLGSIDENAGEIPYYDLTFSSTDVLLEESLQLQVSVTTASVLNQLRVWVDWNDDKDFFDSGELVASFNPTEVLNYEIPFSVPPGTPPGPKRMRLRLHQPNLGGNLSPCGNSTSGKVIDFKLNVTTPSSSIVGSAVYHAAWSGSLGDAVDNVKVIAKQSQVPQILGFENLINSSGGINGIQFEVQDLRAALSPSDFVFQWSPQGAYEEDLHPPENWDAAPGPVSIENFAGAPSTVLIQWPDGTIMNRWLRITVLGNSNTGLPDSEVYFVGHLLGETTGPTDGVFTVSFADIAGIRSAVGQQVDSGSNFDLDKSGIVSFSDISLMRQNIGGQLPAITISPSSGIAAISSNANGKPKESSDSDRERQHQSPERQPREPIHQSPERQRREYQAIISSDRVSISLQEPRLAFLTVITRSFRTTELGGQNLAHSGISGNQLNRSLQEGLTRSGLHDETLHQLLEEEKQVFSS